jgi:hypothetical protein
VKKHTLTSIALAASLFLLTGCQAATEEPDTSTETSEPAEQSPSFSLEITNQLGIEGVSPELIVDPSGGYLLITTGLGQDRVYRSADGVTFTPEPSIQVPMGSDYSLIQKPDGTWLLYYVTFDGPPTAPGQPMDPSTAIKTVMVSQAADLSLFPQGTPTGIKQEQPGPAWGVPDTYIAPDGSYHMMWVDRAEGENWEVLRTASSPDGLTFTANEGFVISDGYVDPFMLRAEEGNWVLLLSTSPGKAPQKIYVATSTDGIEWDINPTPLMEDASKNYLDPTAVPTGANDWLVVLSTAEKDNAISGPHQYLSGMLTEK